MDYLGAARKERQADTVAALGTALSAIDNAEAVEAADLTSESAASPITGARAGFGSTEGS